MENVGGIVCGCEHACARAHAHVGPKAYKLQFISNIG